MSDRKARFERIADLIKNKQYDRARALLRQMDGDPVAAEWLVKLDDMDPAPTTFEEAQTELREAEAEMLQAEDEITETRRNLTQHFRISTALLVFFGTLLGSLIGAAADFGGAMDTIARFEEYRYPRICVVGSDTILGQELGVSQAWEREFEDLYDVRLTVYSIGSYNGYRRALDGKCAHVVAMSDAMSAADWAALETGAKITCAAEIGFDVIVFVTDINNPINSLSRAKLRDILEGERTTWDAVSPTFGADGEIYDDEITILVRANSGTTALVLEQVGGYTLQRDAEGNMIIPTDRARFVTCADNADCLDKTLSIPGAIYWASASWVASQPADYLHVLSIVVDEEEPPVNPLLQREGDVNADASSKVGNLSNYPIELIRPLYMYVVDNDETNSEERALAEDFMQYVRGVHGQEILDDVFRTHFNPPPKLIKDEQHRIELPPPFGLNPGGTRVICLHDMEFAAGIGADSSAE